MALLAFLASLPGSKIAIPAIYGNVGDVGILGNVGFFKIAMLAIYGNVGDVGNVGFFNIAIPAIYGNVGDVGNVGFFNIAKDAKNANSAIYRECGVLGLLASFRWEFQPPSPLVPTRSDA